MMSSQAGHQRLWHRQVSVLVSLGSADLSSCESCYNTTHESGLALVVRGESDGRYPQMKRSKLLLRIAGVCGVLSAIFLLIWLPEMITYAPGFSYTQNWISDLGGMGSSTIARPDVTTPLTELLLTVMLAIVGMLNTVLAIGLLHNASTTLYRYAAISLLVASLSTILMGVFPETAFDEVPHLVSRSRRSCYWSRQRF